MELVIWQGVLAISLLVSVGFGADIASSPTVIDNGTLIPVGLLVALVGVVSLATWRVAVIFTRMSGNYCRMSDDIRWVKRRLRRLPCNANHECPDDPRDDNDEDEDEDGGDKSD